MRVPSSFNRPGWQRFLSGLVFGAVFGWLLFLMLFGMMHDEQVKLIAEQQEEIESLNEKIKIYQQDIEDINTKNENKLLIHHVKISLTNADKLKLTEREKYELEEAVKKEMEGLLLNKNIETVTENRELLISSLENKQFAVEKKKYRFTVKQLYLYTTIEFYLDVHHIKET